MYSQVSQADHLLESVLPIRESDVSARQPLFEERQMSRLTIAGGVPVVDV